MVGAIVRNREDKDDRGAFCLGHHFAIVNTTARRVAGAGEQGTHWFVVAFHGRLLDTHTFTVYAWDPMDSDRPLRSCLRSCDENNIKVQHTILMHQKDGWTCGYCALAFISVLARTDIHVDRGAITLPPMEHALVEEVQLVLKDMVAREHDIIDHELQGIASSLSSVTRWEKLWLAQVVNCHNESKVIWTQVMLTGRLKQQRVPVWWVPPPHTPLSTRKARRASVAHWPVPTPSRGLHYPSSSHNVKCTATSRSDSASGRSFVGCSVMLGVTLSLDATNIVNQWCLLPVACTGRAGTWGERYLLCFCLDADLFFLEVVLFLDPEFCPWNVAVFFLDVPRNSFFREPSKILVPFDIF